MRTVHEVSGSKVHELAALLDKIYAEYGLAAVFLGHMGDPASEGGRTGDYKAHELVAASMTLPDDGDTDSARGCDGAHPSGCRAEYHRPVPSPRFLALAPVFLRLRWCPMRLPRCGFAGSWGITGCRIL